MKPPTTPLISSSKRKREPLLAHYQRGKLASRKSTDVQALKLGENTSSTTSSIISILGVLLAISIAGGIGYVIYSAISGGGGLFDGGTVSRRPGTIDYGQPCEVDEECASGACGGWEEGTKRCCPRGEGNYRFQIPFEYLSPAAGMVNNWITTERCHNLPLGSSCQYWEQCENPSTGVNRTTCNLETKTCTLRKQPTAECFKDEECTSNKCRGWEFGKRRCCPYAEGNDDSNRCDRLPANAPCQYSSQCEYNDAIGTTRIACVRNDQGNLRCLPAPDGNTMNDETGEGPLCSHDDECTSGVCAGWEFNVKRCCPRPNGNQDSRCHNLPFYARCQYSGQCEHNDKLGPQRYGCYFDSTKASDEFMHCLPAIAMGESCKWDGNCQSGACGEFASGDDRCCPGGTDTVKTDYRENRCHKIPKGFGCWHPNQCDGDLMCNASKVCSELLADRETCTEDSQCQSGECAGFAKDIDKCCPGVSPSGNGVEHHNRCYNLANDDHCEHDDQCSSKYCKSNVCTAKIQSGETCVWGKDSYCQSGACKGWKRDELRCCPTSDNGNLNRCDHIPVGENCQMSEQCEGNKDQLGSNKTACIDDKCQSALAMNDRCNDDKKCQSGQCGGFKWGVDRCCPGSGEDGDLAEKRDNRCHRIPKGFGCWHNDQCNGLLICNATFQCSDKIPNGGPCRRSHDNQCVSGVCRGWGFDELRCCPTNDNGNANRCDNIPTNENCEMNEQCKGNKPNENNKREAACIKDDDGNLKCGDARRYNETCRFGSSCVDGRCAGFARNELKCCPQTGEIHWNRCYNLQVTDSCETNEQCGNTTTKLWCSNNKCVAQRAIGETCVNHEECTTECLKWGEDGTKTCCREAQGNEMTRCDFLLAKGEYGNRRDLGDRCIMNEQCKNNSLAPIEAGLASHEKYVRKTSCRAPIDRTNIGEEMEDSSVSDTSQRNQKRCRYAMYPGDLCKYGSDCQSGECLGWEYNVKRCCRKSEGNEMTRCDFLLANEMERSPFSDLSNICNERRLGDLCEFNEQCQNNSKSGAQQHQKTSCRPPIDHNEDKCPSGAVEPSNYDTLRRKKRCRSAYDPGVLCEYGSSCKSGKCHGWEAGRKRCCRTSEGNAEFHNRCDNLLAKGSTPGNDKELGDECEYNEQCLLNNRTEQNLKTSCRIPKDDEDPWSPNSKFNRADRLKKRCREALDPGVLCEYGSSCKSGKCHGWEAGRKRCCRTSEGNAEFHNRCDNLLAKKTGNTPLLLGNGKELGDECEYDQQCLLNNRTEQHLKTVCRTPRDGEDPWSPNSEFNREDRLKKRCRAV